MSQVVFQWTGDDYRQMVLDLLALPPEAGTIGYVTYLTKKDFEKIKDISSKYAAKGWKLPRYQKKIAEQKLAERKIDDLKAWSVVSQLPAPPKTAIAPAKQRFNPETLVGYLLEGEPDLFRKFWDLASNQDEIVRWDDYYIVRYIYIYYGKLGCLFENWAKFDQNLQKYRAKHGVAC